MHVACRATKVLSKTCTSINVIFRVAKLKHPRVLGDQKISEDNQILRPGCPPDYQIFL